MLFTNINTYYYLKYVPLYPIYAVFLVMLIHKYTSYILVQFIYVQNLMCFKCNFLAVWVQGVEARPLSGELGSPYMELLSLLK